MYIKTNKQINKHFANEGTRHNRAMIIIEKRTCISRWRSCCCRRRPCLSSLLIEGDAIYWEALEQQTIPDADTLSFTIYQIEPVGRLMNQINRSLKQTNETTEMIIETRTTYNAEKCSNSCDDT